MLATYLAMFSNKNDKRKKKLTTILALSLQSPFYMKNLECNEEGNEESNEIGIENGEEI